MKLDDFIKQTLLDITNGVLAAQEDAKVLIAPSTIEGEKKTEGQSVVFEVAVTLNSGGGGGISVFSMGDLRGEVSKETVNRISFEIPVHFNAPNRERSKP